MKAKKLIFKTINQTFKKNIFTKNILNKNTINKSFICQVCNKEVQKMTLDECKSMLGKT